MSDAPELGTPEWADSAERSEWAFMAKMLKECMDILPHKLSGAGVALDIALERSRSGWRTKYTRTDTIGWQPAFQTEVAQWMLKCFTEEIAADKTERNHRFLEEALELVQSIGCTTSEAHQLVDYVYGRDIGDPPQEVGGVMVTLAALCLANNMNMAASGYVELERINDPETVVKIRKKQAAKPKHSPLPIPPK